MFGCPRNRGNFNAGGVLHVLIYTPRGNSIRVISLRKATPKERIRYAQAQKQADPSAT